MEIEEITKSLVDRNTSYRKARSPEAYPVQFSDDGNLAVIIVGVYSTEDDGYNPCMRLLKPYVIRIATEEIQELEAIHTGGYRVKFSTTWFKLSSGKIIVSNDKVAIEGPVMQEYWEDGRYQRLRQVSHISEKRTIKEKSWKKLSEFFQ